MLIGPLTNSVLYGKGVFTTVRVLHGQPQQWEKHWSRLLSNSTSLSIDLHDLNADQVLEELTRELASKQIARGRARITIMDQSESSIWPVESQSGVAISIIVGENRFRPERFTVTASPHLVNSTSPIAGIKSCNYLEHLMAYEEARGRGFNEAVRLNERGHITSACMANVFWETGGKLFTPSLSTGCLPGTTREFVLENFECEEVESGIEDLESADRIFLTSAGLGVAPAAEFEGRKLDTTPHPLLTLMPF